MIKLMIIGRRAPGISRSAAHRHLRDKHGRMVVCPPAGAGAMPVDYVQNHVVDGAYPSGTHAHAIERDLVTELWFDDIGQLRASTSTPYYLDNLKPDEPRFVDDGSVVKMIVRPELVLEGNDGPYKAFLAISAVSSDQFAPAALDQRVMSADGIRRAVRNVAMPPPDGSEPFVSMVYEAWFEMPEAAHALADDFGTFASSSHGIDVSRSFALVAEQYDTARLTALF